MKKKVVINTVDNKQQIEIQTDTGEDSKQAEKQTTKQIDKQTNRQLTDNKQGTKWVEKKEGWVEKKEGKTLRAALSPTEIRERLKIEYIRGSTLEELSDKYGYSISTLKQYRKRFKWTKDLKAFRDKQKEITDDVTTQLYAGFKASINIKYQATWAKLLEIIDLALDNPEAYLFYKDGGIKWGALDVLSSIIDRAQRGQERANGNIPAEVAFKLSLEREKLILLRKDLDNKDADASVALTDNFENALLTAAQSVWEDMTMEETTKALDVTKSLSDNKKSKK